MGDFAIVNLGVTLMLPSSWEIFIQLLCGYSSVPSHCYKGLWKMYVWVFGANLRVFLKVFLWCMMHDAIGFTVENFIDNIFIQAFCPHRNKVKSNINTIASNSLMIKECIILILPYKLLPAVSLSLYHFLNLLYWIV